MYCQYCGSDVEENSKFCPNCGASMEEEITQNSSSDYQSYEAPESSQSPYASYTPTYSQDNTADKTGKNYAIASLVCSLVSFFCCGWILGILGIVFGCMSKSNGYKGGMATAGIICGIIGLIGTLFSTIYLLS